MIDLSEYSECTTLFLDRDGVINRLRPNDYVKCWEEFEFMPGIIEEIAKWNLKFKYIIVITNQRGIGKGLMDEKDLNKIHKNMVSIIRIFGGRIDKIYYCADVDDDSPNRKPNIGMALQAKKDFPEIEFTKSLMIGDSESDEAFAKNINCKFLMIK